MKNLVFLLATALALNAGQLLALPAARNVYSQDAQGNNSTGLDLKIWQGYGLTINFMSTGEIIKQVWLGDPTHFSLTSNGKLCQQGTSNDENCGTGGATVLFLRQIKPINFPHLTSSDDGSTQITILTSSADGQKQYQFKLIPAKGQPSYTSLIIQPDSQRPSPVLRQPTLTTARTRPQLVTRQPATQQLTDPVTKKPAITKPVSQRRTVATRQENTRSRQEEKLLTDNSLPPRTVNVANNSTTTVALSKPVTGGNSIPRNDANALAYGLATAVSNREIKPYSTTWKKFQDAIRLLRRGKSQNEAISLSGVPPALFEQLINRGR
ncbi:hypothetical protein [Nostoc sp. FACHB-190]|uniref:hypothetical protein n=1 Tax=Nostoc sp. FACHB-190 TaxID=2692838 RepID=UPI001685F94F|nr:hypothetical protein [Nostoc sp. FACHB-190]MBD2302253.1 hypothetical protein [Nostoc sp. FACHB-190]